MRSISYYFQLGLPLSSICNVPCSTVNGTTSIMVRDCLFFIEKSTSLKWYNDIRGNSRCKVKVLINVIWQDVGMLEKLIQDDVSAAKTPVLLVGFAGTPFILQSIQFYVTVTIQYISCIFWLTAMRKSSWAWNLLTSVILMQKWTNLLVKRLSSTRDYLIKHKNYLQRLLLNLWHCMYSSSTFKFKQSEIFGDTLTGSPHLGSVDHLDELRKICKNHKIWLHVEG